MYYEIEKDVISVEDDKEIVDRYTVVFTSLSGYFAVSKYNIYGEEVLKEPLPYSVSEDFLNVLGDNLPNVNTFYYVHREQGDRLSNNFTVWKNGVKVYENLSEEYQIRDEEPVEDEKKYTGKDKFPVHPIEERTIEEREEYIIRPDRRHFYVRRKSIIPFSTDAIIISYDIPNAQVFPGYDSIKEISQQEYNDRKVDIESIYNSEGNVFKIKETGEYYHLSSNGERVIETNLPFYKDYKPSFSSYNPHSGNYAYKPLSDHYDVAFRQYSRVGREVYTIMQIPQSFGYGILGQFTSSGIGDSITAAANLNYTYFKSLKGIRDFGVYSTNVILSRYVRWWDLFDGGFHSESTTSDVYHDGYNTQGGRVEDSRTFEGVLPEYFEYNTTGSPRN